MGQHIVKLYIAASSNPTERPRVDAAFAVAASMPHIEIIGDWRPSVDEHGSNPTDRQVGIAAAFQCHDALQKADLLWLLVPETMSIGAWFELGFATRGQIDIICSGKFDQTIFTTFANACFSDDAAAVALIAKWEGNPF